MTTQILVRYDISDASRFRAAFDADAEDRSGAGLSLLQLWREGAGRMWALYQTGNARRASEYLSGAAEVFNRQGGVTATEVHILETA